MSSGSLKRQPRAALAPRLRPTPHASSKAIRFRHDVDSDLASVTTSTDSIKHTTSDPWLKNISSTNALSASIASDQSTNGVAKHSKPDAIETAAKTMQTQLAARQTAVREALVVLLDVAGLQKTADCLRSEAGLANKTSSIRLSLDGKGPHVVMSKVKDSIKARDSADSAARTDQRQRMEALKAEMEAQQRRMAAMHGVMKDLRHQIVSAAQTSHEERAAMVDEYRSLQARTAERKAEAEKIKNEIQESDLARSRLEQEVAEAEAEVERLKQAPPTATRSPSGPLEPDTFFDRFDSNHDGQITRAEFEQGVKAMRLEAQKIRAVLLSWERPNGARRHAELAFREADRDGDLRLHWSNDEVKAFVKGTFARANIALPPWSDHVWYDLYRQADVDYSNSLDMTESMRLARQCFEATLTTCLRSPAVAQGFGDHPLSNAERWAKTYTPQPVKQQRFTVNGETLDLLELAARLQTLVAANQRHRPRMTKVIESGDHVRTALQAYKNCDADANGFLTWNNDEIRNFLTTIFRTYGLIAPMEDQMYNIYSTFDRDHNYALDARECLEMVDITLRSLFVVDPIKNPQVLLRNHQQNQQHGSAYVRVGSRPRAASPNSSPALPMAQLPQLPHSSPQLSLPSSISNVRIAQHSSSGAVPTLADQGSGVFSVGRPLSPGPNLRSGGASPTHAELDPVMRMPSAPAAAYTFGSPRTVTRSSSPSVTKGLMSASAAQAAAAVAAAATAAPAPGLPMTAVRRIGSVPLAGNSPTSALSSSQLAPMLVPAGVAFGMAPTSGGSPLTTYRSSSGSPTAGVMQPSLMPTAAIRSPSGSPPAREGVLRPILPLRQPA